jgi:TolB-like protein
MLMRSRGCLSLTALATLLLICPARSALAQVQPTRGAVPVTAQAVSSRLQVVLTFPFENTGQQASLEWLSEGLSELSIERLAGPGYYFLSRQDRLDALELIGLPRSTRFSHATMLKIGEEVDADDVIFGTYSSDSDTLTVTARVLHLSPPALSPEFTQSGPLSDVTNIHARLGGQLRCALASAQASAPGCGAGAAAVAAFAAQVPPLSANAFEMYSRGLTDSKEDVRLRDLRAAARLEPQWDAPGFALGDSYFAHRDCDSALPWLIRVPQASANGILAGFEAGVCQLLHGEPAKAEATFSAILDGPPPLPGPLPEAESNLGVALARDGK